MKVRKLISPETLHELRGIKKSLLELERRKRRRRRR